MSARAVNYLVLMVMGVAWGAVFPLTKIALNGGHAPFGILVWQTFFSVTLSGLGVILRGKRLPVKGGAFGVYLGIGAFGAVLPNYFSYTASAQLPAGIMSILIALVPLFSLPVALLLGFEKPVLKRMFGVACGAGAVMLLVLPGTSLPDPAKTIFVLVGVLAPFFYGIEGNFLTWYGSRGLDPLQILAGAALISFLVSLTLALSLGQFFSPFRPWGASEWAIVLGAVLNWASYTSYVWLIGRTGPVFSAQVAYLVTGWGVVWSMVLLGESYSLWVWAAFALMVLGIGLVQPREAEKPEWARSRTSGVPEAVEAPEASE